MEFVEVDEATFADFAQHSELQNFIQSGDMVRSQQNRGLRVWLLGVKRDAELVAAGAVLVRKNRGLTIAECLYGPLVDIHDTPLLEFFIKNLRNYAKTHGADELVISPYVETRSLDENADPVAGFDNTWFIDKLQQLGFAHKGYETNMVNVNWMLVKDLEGIDSPEALEATLDYRNKKAIRKAESNGVYVRQATSSSDIAAFTSLMERVGEDKQFASRDSKYYSSIFEYARPDFARFMLAYLNVGHFIATAEQRIAEIETTIAELEQKSPLSKKEVNKRKTAQELLASYQDSLKHAHDIAPKDLNEPVLLAGILFFVTGTEVVCVYGGSDSRYAYFNGMIAVYWEMMKEAVTLHKKRYNYFGTFGVKDKTSPGHGIYLFKKGFGGSRMINLVGEFSMVLSPQKVALHRTIKRLRAAFR